MTGPSAGRVTSTTSATRLITRLVVGRREMGFLDRLKTGWALSMDSLGVLRAESSLTAFPFVAGVAGAVYVGLVMGGAVLLTGTDPGPATYAALFAVYLGSAFIAAFFAAALTYNAREVFRGRDPTLADGLAAAWRNRRSLLAWAVVSAVVGVLLRVVESQDNPLARVAAMLFGVAWGVLTYFVVPVIVFEEVSVAGMFERSGETFTGTWGETVGAGFGVGVVTAAFTLAGLALAALVFVAFGTTALGVLGALAVGAVVLLAAYLLGSTLGSVAKTALYVYATEGERPDGFERVDFASAVR